MSGPHELANPKSKVWGGWCLPCALTRVGSTCSRHTVSGCVFSKSWRCVIHASRSQKSFVFVTLVFWQLKIFFRSGFHRRKTRPEVVQKCRRRIITIVKLYRTLFSCYAPFLAIFAYFWHFSRLFRHFLKNLVSDPHRNFKKHCRSGNWIVRLTIPQKAP